MVNLELKNIKGRFVLNIEYIFVKSKNDFCCDEEQFLNMLRMNIRLKIEDKNFIVDGKKVSFELKHEYVEASKEDLFHLIITSELSKKAEAVSALETMDSFLYRLNENVDFFVINTIYDDVSMYYAQKLYPEIIKIENQLRKIIYLFMLKNVGSNWTQRNIPKEMKKSVEHTLEKNNEININANYLNYADFVVLGWFFFEKYTIESNFQNLVEKIKNPQNQTPEKLDDLAKRFESKSNWERYFSDKIEIDNLSGKWDELYGYRNQVAHTKKIRKEHHDDAMKLMKEMGKAFEECLSHMDEVVLTEEESVAVEQVAQDTIYANKGEPWPKKILVGNHWYTNGTWGNSLFEQSISGDHLNLAQQAVNIAANHSYIYDPETAALIESAYTSAEPLIGSTYATRESLMGATVSAMDNIHNRGTLQDNLFSNLNEKSVRNMVETKAFTDDVLKIKTEENK